VKTLRRGLGARHLLLLGLLACRAWCGDSPAVAASLLVEFTFADGSLANTGTLGSSGTFVPGPGGENAAIGEGLSGAGQGMDNTAAPDFGATGGSGGTLRFGADPRYARLTSYTVSGFYRIPRQNSALADTNGAHLLRIDFGSNPDLIYENGRIFNAGGALPDVSTQRIWGPTDVSGVFLPDVWVFFAMTYDGAGGTTKLRYYGANQRDVTVRLLATGNVAGRNTGDVASGIDIGNAFGGIRPFDGLLDNVRLHGSTTDATGALGLAALQALADAGFAETLGGGGPPVHLGTLEPRVPRPTPPGAPRPSDVMLSSRWPRAEAFQAITDFHATRLEWNYPGTDAAFVAQILGAGLTYAGTINAELPDQIGGDTRTLGRDKDMFGVVIHNPELPAAESARGDVNDPAYRQIVLDHATFAVDAGADRIMVDDPGMTFADATDLGGGYGDVSMQRFRSYLTDHSTPEQRAAWGMPADLSDFDYAAWAVSHDAGATVPPAVRDLFLGFHRESLDEFYGAIRSALDLHAARRVPFASNNGTPNYQMDFYRQYADFWIGETGRQYGDPTAPGIYFKVKDAEALGKIQVFSPPNDGTDFIPTRAEYVALSRRIIATSHASGSATLVPWDVWRRGMDERFFGTVAEFGDLYGLVHDHPAYYDAHEEVFAAGAGVLAQRAPGLGADPLHIVGGSGQVFVTIRTTPGNPAAPIIVHMVDWADTPVAFSLALTNAMFGGGDGAPLRATLLLPGAAPQASTGTLDGATRTAFDVPALAPYGVLAIDPGQTQGGCR
jgi:hypothetical protein